MKGGGSNLYGLVGNRPVARIDVLGYQACCGGQTYDPATQCCCDGQTIRSRAETDTGVSVCKGYIKGSLLWGWVPSHAFLKCGGKGFGLYAKSHLQHGNSCGALDDDGVIKDDDLRLLAIITLTVIEPLMA